jgi:predicted transcriptional regulator of viral defense system
LRGHKSGISALRGHVANEKSEVGEILAFVRTDRLSGDANLIRIITADQLLARGLTFERIRTLVRRGTLIRVGRGRYVTAKSAAPVLRLPEGRHLVAAGAALAGSGPHLVASHTTAARIHGLDLLDRPDDTVMLTQARGKGTRHPPKGTRLTAAALPASHVTVRYGLRVTTVARTVVDLARVLPFRAGVVTADAALDMRKVTKDELREILASSARWPGLARARDVVEFADGLSESVLESIARAAFRDLGLPPPQLNVWVGGDDVVGRADFLWEQFNTIGEADGALKYKDPDRARRQLWRDSRLRDAGFEVVHFTWQEIDETPERVAASIRAAFERGKRLSTRSATGPAPATGYR